MNRSSAVPPRTSATVARISMTAAEASLMGKSARRTAPGTGTEAPLVWGLSPAKAPLPHCETGQRLLEMAWREIRPQHVGEPHFRVGRLPQQEVRQPHFARGADQQIRSEEHTSELQSRE